MLFKDDEVARADALAVREDSGWYRWTHDTVDVTGADSTALLDKLLVNTVAQCKVGREKYTTMLDDEGRIVDDLMAIHLEENHWWLSTLYGPQMVRWLGEHAEGYDVAFSDITPEIDMFSVQGPRSAEVMDKLLDAPVDELKRFQIVNASIGGISVRVDRGGFTGELGYEIYCSRSDSDQILKLLRDADSRELQTLEVFVRSLPMEKGMAVDARREAPCRRGASPWRRAWPLGRTITT